MNRMQRSNGSATGTGALASGLGWFSVALGAAEVLAPEALAEWLGMRGSETILRAYGVREMMTGLGILASKDATGWVWGRVGGDALDMATLGSAINEQNPKNGNATLALAAVLGVTLIDVACAARLGREKSEMRHNRESLIADYGQRSGFRAPPEQMRGIARNLDIADMHSQRVAH